MHSQCKRCNAPNLRTTAVNEWRGQTVSISLFSFGALALLIEWLEDHLVCKTRAQQLLRWETVPEQSGSKSGGQLLCPFLWGKQGPDLTNVTWAEAYLQTKWYPDPSSHLATTDMGQKAVYTDTESVNRKSGGLCTFLWGGAGSPSNTILPGSRPTSVPSGILIHPTVWPQYSNVTDRTDRYDNSPIVYSKPFYKWLPKNRATNLQRFSSRPSGQRKPRGDLLIQVRLENGR